MTKYISRAAIAAAALTLGVSGANAYSNLATGSLTVSANVVTACSVNGGTLSFGNVATGNSAAASSTGVTITCPATVGYNVDLDQGTHWDSTNGKWQVADSGATHFIGYLLQNGAGSGSNWATTAGTGSGTAQPITIYGVLDTVGSQPNGSYNDVVQIKVSY